MKKSRIPRISKKLNKLWKDNPEINLTKLVYKLTKGSTYSLVYVSDEHIEKQLDRMILLGIDNVHD